MHSCNKSIVRVWASKLHQGRQHKSPAAPDITVQIARLDGGGGYDPTIDEAFGVWAAAIEDAEAGCIWTLYVRLPYKYRADFRWMAPLPPPGCSFWF
jgi:hypothetical protein